ADHVFALLQQGLAVLVMEGVGAGHVHGVNLRAGGQVLHRGEGEPGAVLFGVLLCPLPGAGVDAGQFPQAAVQRPPDIGIGDPAGPDGGKSQHGLTPHSAWAAAVLMIFLITSMSSTTTYSSLPWALPPPVQMLGQGRPS